MGTSLSEYLLALDARSTLLWPKPPRVTPLEATPSLKPLPEIRAVAWSIYGTLLHIHDGQLLHVHPQPLRMQVALQKSIDEFNMWNSMSRKPGQPWEYMLLQYTKLIDEQRLAATKHKGDSPEIDSVRLWAKIVERLEKNEYVYDRAFYGDRSELALKIAYFFHAMLQGAAADPEALPVLRRIAGAGLRQGLLDDGQAFTVAQLTHLLQRVEPSALLAEFIDPRCVRLSCDVGVRKPSTTLFSAAAEQYRGLGIETRHVLYISHRLVDDLSVARRFGFRTALLVGDAKTCNVKSSELKDPETRPDRLVTELVQVCEILGC